MASGYTQQDIAKMAAEIESLRSQLAAKEEVVSNLESEVVKLESNITNLESNVTSLESNITSLESNITSLETNVTTLETDVTKLESHISKLEYELTWLRKKLFGKMSERFINSDPDSRQLDIFGEQLSDNEREELERAAAQEQELITRTVTANKPRTPRKDISFENLRIEETTIEPEGINFEEYVCIGTEETNRLAYKPAEFFVKRTIRKKYALKNQLTELEDEEEKRPSVVIAPLPDSPIHKCMADTSLLTEIIIQKYLYHLPFHRQIARFGDLGVRISSSTVGDWFSQSCELLRPLYDHLRRRVLSTDYIQVDESTLPVIDNEKRRAVKGYLWVVRNPDNGEVFFHYDRGSRSEKTALTLLHGFNGAIQSDGYQVYKRFEALDGKLMLGCWAHARRKFDEALAENKKLATEALLQIQSLYAIEREADETGATPEQRRELRRTKAYPVLVTFEKWLYDNYTTLLPQSRTAKAISYTYSIFPKLSRYHLNGRYRIDNNLVENAIRPLAIGRKNYLFCGNSDAAIRAAMVYSLLGSCKAAGINPAEWLEDVLSKIYSYTKENRNLEELLPHSWKK
ncbi:MAG: IS66 family transposase [Bacteroidales bacterium]|jgi:transposase/cell division protein FtsB|nr:IS66 family transposase [Bacteroidales bacterium]